MDGDVADGSSAGAGSLVIQASQVSTATAGSQASSGGLIGGTGNSATATASPTMVAAYLRGSSTTITTGNLRISAEAKPEADAKTSGTAFGLLAGVGGSTSTASASPTVNAYIGNGAVVHVGGNIDISATVDRQSAGTDGPTYEIESANATNDSLQVNDHGLQTGDVIEYDSSNQDPTAGCAESAAIGGLTASDCVTETVDGVTQSFIVRRAYNVIAFGEDNIRLGSQFDGQSCASNPDAASCVDTVNDTILFGKAHNLLTGDRVRYRNVGTSTIGGLNLAGATFYVLVIDERTIRLVATQSVQTTASDFVKSFAVSNVSGSTVTLMGHGLTNGTRSHVPLAAADRVQRRPGRHTELHADHHLDVLAEREPRRRSQPQRQRRHELAVLRRPGVGQRDGARLQRRRPGALQRAQQHRSRRHAHRRAPGRPHLPRHPDQRLDDPAEEQRPHHRVGQLRPLGQRRPDHPHRRPLVGR